MSTGRAGSHSATCIASIVTIGVALLASGCGNDDPTEPPLPPDAEALVVADSLGDLYGVDLASGRDSLILDTFTTGPLGTRRDIGPISSLEWVVSRSTLVAGMGGRADCRACLLAVLSPAIGPATPVDTLEDLSSQIDAVAGLAYRPVDGAFFLTAGSGAGSGGGGGGTPGLWQLDTQSFEATLVSASTGGGAGMGVTVANNDIMYLASGDTLLVVDQDTGVDSRLAEFSFVGFPPFQHATRAVVALTTRRSDGVVFGLLRDGAGAGQPGTTYLVRVNLGNAALQNLGALSRRMDGLAFVPAGSLP